MHILGTSEVSTGARYFGTELELRKEGYFGSVQWDARGLRASERTLRFRRSIRVDDIGRERERYNPTYGAYLKVGDGAKKGQILSEWDSYTIPLLTEHDEHAFATRCTA